MQEILTIILMVLGGLGIFLLGMKHLSEGLQATAGGGLRKFMAHATSHRLVGVGTGIVSTMIVQSSSIITVMLVGFVSTALMTLPQAINVLIGANIGTTATVWIIAYAPDPQMLGFIGCAIGGAMYFFLRGERIHHLGLTIIGLGLVFLGLYFMSKGVAPIRTNPAIASVFTKLDATRWGGIALIALIAALFTAVIQSSAATIAITMTLASQLTSGTHLPILSYEAAIAVLFGANIGTTATGWIAAIGGTADARRTALSHTLSNVIGSIVLLPLFSLFVKFGQTLFPNWNEVREVVMNGSVIHMRTNVMAPIAITDTLFAVCRGVILFPFVKPFARLIEKLIHQPENEKPHLSVLKIGAKLSPIIACDQALVEVQFMAKSDLGLLDCVRKVASGVSDDDVENHIVHREDILDNVQKEVTEFLGSVMSKRLSADVAERARRLLRFTDELESISDETSTILKVVKRLRSQKVELTDESRMVVMKIHERVEAFARMVSPWIRSPRPAIDLKAVQDESKSIHELIRACRMERLTMDATFPLKVLGELDMINAYERVRAYYLNIAETLAGGKR